MSDQEKEQLRELLREEHGKDVWSGRRAVTVQVSLLVAAVVGVWKLSAAVNRASDRLASLEHKVALRWSYPMAREAWQEAGRINPNFRVPDVSAIRETFAEELK